MAYCKSCPEIDPENVGVDMGCLPCVYEIRQAVHELAFWACHSNPNHICQCAVNEARKHAIPLPAAPTVGEQFGEVPECWKTNYNK